MEFQSEGQLIAIEIKDSLERMEECSIELSKAHVQEIAHAIERHVPAKNRAAWNDDLRERLRYRLILRYNTDDRWSVSYELFRKAYMRVNNKQRGEMALTQIKGIMVDFALEALGFPDTTEPLKITPELLVEIRKHFPDFPEQEQGEISG